MNPTYPAIPARTAHAQEKSLRMDLNRDSGAGFTYTDYGHLLTALDEAGYLFARFPQAERLLAQDRPFVLLRHDVDFDLAAAARMAHVEAKMGVVSTYFFMVRTEFYNLFSQAGTEHVRAILDDGHDIGLHFDCAAYPPGMETSELAQASALECGLLESWFGRHVETISIHRPQPHVLTGDPALTAPRPHTYMDLYTKRLHYVADSRGGWHYGTPLAQPAFAQRRPMQILVHPIWWGEEATPPLQTLHNFEEQRRREIARQMAANSTVYRPQAAQTPTQAEPKNGSALNPLRGNHP